jgi:caa(3)-type oxidase subunit IV
MSASEKIHARHHVATFIALLVLATASLLVSRLVHSAAVGVTFSLVIALAKALLVLAIFMHLVEQPFRTHLALLGAVLLLLTLVILTAADVATRGRLSEPRQQLGAVGPP